MTNLTHFNFLPLKKCHNPIYVCYKAMDKFNQFSHAKLYFVSHCNDTVHCWLFTVISFNCTFL